MSWHQAAASSPGLGVRMAAVGRMRLEGGLLGLRSPCLCCGGQVSLGRGVGRDLAGPPRR